MTTNLITGKSGTPHVTSGDMGAIQAGLVGNDSYLLQNSDGTFPAITMQDANNALVPVLNLVLEGRYARVTETQTVTIESGVTGQNRNDLVCMKYTRDDKNIESMTLEVLKGTPAEGTAADPTIPDGSIHEGAGEAWIPLARIPISGITPGTPVMLVKQLPPMSRLWDSVSQQTLINSQYGTVTGVKAGNVAQILVNWKSANTASWGNGLFGTLPEGWRPLIKTEWAYSGRDGGSQRVFTLLPDGTFGYSNRGAAQNGDSFTTSASYIVAG